jgi:integrase/recombinase XerD
VPVPQEAKSALDQYLKTRTIKKSTSQLLISKYNNRFSTRDVRRVCERLSKFASALLPEEEKFHLSPHMLRHNFLKKIADTPGVNIVQKISGNVSMSEIRKIL